MARAFAALALLTGVAVGCGGALAGNPDGGAGTGGAGTAGTTGAGGTGGGIDGSSYVGDYTWGGVLVHVGLSGVAPSWLSLGVSDPAVNDPPNLGDITNTQFPAATTLNPSDGAYISALYACTSSAIASVAIYSCADPTSAPVGPGCLTAFFSAAGPTGDFVLPDGTHCAITEGAGNLLLPVPTDSQSPTGDGAFTLTCASSGGVRRRLEGSFALLARSSFLLCNP